MGLCRLNKLCQLLIVYHLHQLLFNLFRRAARGVKVRLDRKKKDAAPSKVS